MDSNNGYVLATSIRINKVVSAVAKIRNRMKVRLNLALPLIVKG